MSGLIDTNLLIYAANRNSTSHEKACGFLRACLTGTDTFYLCWGNLYEFLRVVTHPKVFPRPLAWKEASAFLKPFIESPNVEIVLEGEDHFSVLQEILRGVRNPQGNFLHDCHTAALAKEHGVKTIYTHDTDFRLFSFLEVVDPVAG